jgi:hypothetical protein
MRELEAQVPGELVNRKFDSSDIDLVEMASGDSDFNHFPIVAVLDRRSCRRWGSMPAACSAKA